MTEHGQFDAQGDAALRSKSDAPLQYSLATLFGVMTYVAVGLGLPHPVLYLLVLVAVYAVLVRIVILIHLG